MRNVYIDLDKGRAVKGFVETVKNLDGKFELRSGFAVLDARSILGIYCLDLSEPILLQIENDGAENLRLLEKFILDDKSFTGGTSNEQTSV